MNSSINFADSGNYENFIEHIINGMYDWVRVLDRDDNIIFMNKAMSKSVEKFGQGKKCYEVIGRSAPCENCTSRKAVFDGQPHKKEEIVGNQVYSVMSSPIKNSQGEIIAVVEVLHNITEMKTLQKKIMEQNKKLQSDLNIAKKLQCSLLPKDLDEDKVKFSFVYQPCEALGGDFVDIFYIDENHLGVYIADISGHGVPASMLTVFLRSTINKHTLSPADALRELYTQFNDNYPDQDMYITIFYAIIDLTRNKIVFSNAGHNACPIVFSSNRFEILRSPGIPISNWLDNPNYQDRELDLFSGDRIFFYTDGIVELKNKEGEQYGEERLLDILLKDFSAPSIVLDNLIQSAYNFAEIKNALKIPDDITLALLEI